MIHIISVVKLSFHYSHKSGKIKQILQSLKFCKKVLHTNLSTIIIESTLTQYCFIVSHTTNEMNQSQGESQQSTVKNTENTMIQGVQIIGTTETGPVSRTHTSVVFYIIVGLMTVFVIIAILYGVSYFPKLHTNGKRNEPNINESVDLHYEDLPLR